MMAESPLGVLQATDADHIDLADFVVVLDQLSRRS
jgi:hypothetical protein